MKRRMTQYLVIDDSTGRLTIQCAKCNYLLCSITENYKNYTLTNEHALSDSGPQYSTTKRFVFRESYCPGCGTQLEVEMCLANSPLIRDVSLNINGSFNVSDVKNDQTYELTPGD